MTVAWEFGGAGHKGDVPSQMPKVGLQLQGHSLGERQEVKCSSGLEGKDRLQVLISVNDKIKPGVSVTELT